MYYKNANAIIIVYDLINYASYERAKFWFNEVIKYHDNSNANGYPIVYLVGNKLDLIMNDQKLRKVNLDVLMEFAKVNNLSTFEVSAKTGQNVTDLFSDINGKLRELYQINRLKNKNTTSSVIDTMTVKSTDKISFCCY